MVKVGIIISSKTGNTKLVADKLKKKLDDKGYDVSIDMVEPVSWDSETIMFENFPILNSYNIVIFGGPVHAFGLNRPMKKYLKEIPIHSELKAYCFLTQFFPFNFLGGNRAMRQLCRMLKNKKIESNKLGIIHWSSKRHNLEIDELIDDLIMKLK